MKRPSDYRGLADLPPAARLLTPEERARLSEADLEAMSKTAAAAFEELGDACREFCRVVREELAGNLRALADLIEGEEEER